MKAMLQANDGANSIYFFPIQLEKIAMIFQCS